MAVEAAKIVINVSAEGTQQAAAGLGKVDDGLKKTEKSAGDFSEAIKTAVSALGLFKLAQLAKDTITAGVEFNKAAEQAKISFEVMTGSAAEADKTIRALRDFAANTPFSFNEIQSATKTLLTFGVESGKAVKVVKMLGDASGGNAERMNRLAAAYGKAASQGKLTGDVVQQMIEAGFNPLNDIAKATGESMEALRKRMSAGGVSADELTGAFASATSEGGQFYGMLQRQSESLTGLQSTMDDAFATLGGAITEGLIGPMKLATNALTTFAMISTEAVNLFNQMPGPIKGVVQAMAILLTVTTALAIAQATGVALKVKDIALNVVTIAKTVASTIAKWANYAAQMAVNAAVAVGVPTQWAAIAAAVALTTAVVVTAGAMTGMANAQIAQTKATKNANTELSRSTVVFNNLVSAAKAWGAAQAQSNAALVAANDSARSYASILSDTTVAQRSIQALERAGILSREESLNQQIEAEKKALEATIARARASSNPTLYAKNVEAHRASIAQMEGHLDRLNQKPKEYGDQWKNTLDSLNSQFASAQEFYEGRFGETMARLNEGFNEYGEVIEDNHSGWLESIEEVKSAYQNVFNSITQGFSAVGTIADNIGQAQIMRIDEEMAKRQEAGTLTMEMEKQYEDQKKKIQRDAAVRAKAFAVFQAALNIPLMVMEGFKLGNLPGAVVGGTIGALQLAAAASTPIPSAQFGGEFTVPPGYQGDSGLVRVNSGEKVSVEPVRNSDDSPKSVVVQIGQRDFEGYLQEVLNSGRVTIRRQGVVRYA
jgi:tape measure domain-containing protein